MHEEGRELALLNCNVSIMAAWWPNPKSILSNSILPSSFSPSYTHKHTHAQLSPPFLLLPLLYTRKHTHSQFAHSPSASYSDAIYPALISSLSLQHSSRIHYTCKVTLTHKGMCDISLHVYSVLGYNLYTEGGLWTPASAHTETPTIGNVHTTNGFVGASILHNSVTDTISRQVWKFEICCTETPY